MFSDSPRDVRYWGVVAAVFGFLAVALGAFGAHGMRDVLGAAGLQTNNTAVHYQFFHSLALLLTTAMMAASTQHGWRIAAGCFLAGILLFSGSLYALVLTGNTWLGMITPAGGLCFLAGWSALALTFWRAR